MDSFVGKLKGTIKMPLDLITLSLCLMLFQRVVFAIPTIALTTLPSYLLPPYEGMSVARPVFLNCP